MSAIRLISDEILIYTCDPISGKLQENKNYIFSRPKGNLLIVAYANHFRDGTNILPLAKTAIKNNLGVVYVCNNLPTNPIVDEHIIYLKVEEKWLIHTLFMNPLRFCGVITSYSVQNLGLAFSSFTKYFIPMFRKTRDIERLADSYDIVKDNILVEIFGGVGDHLLTIPSLKTLSEQGKNVYVLCEKHRQPCFSNLKYIKGFYTKRSEVNISKFSKVFYLHFGELLNDYRQDFNKQNRIYSVAELCGLKKEDLVIDRPEIVLTEGELNSARRKWGPYKNKIFLGYDSARVDTKIPSGMTQDIINKLKRDGYTVFTSSVRRRTFENCIDLSRQTSLRDLFALLSQMDCILTVDTAFLHMAGAFNKKIFCMMNQFKPSWRCSTYKNCTTYTPNVSCFPCVSRQFVCSKEWHCHTKSCYSFHNLEQVYKDINEFFISRDKLEEENILVVKKQPILPKNIDEEKLPGRLINPRVESNSKIAAFWMGGLGDSVMLNYLCRAIKRKYPNSEIDAFVRDQNQVQVFIFDYPEIRAQFSNLGWAKTFDKIKNDYDIIFEFRPYPYVWNKDKSLNKKFDKELYSSWKKATGVILNSCNEQTFKYYAKRTGLDLCETDMKIPLVKNLGLIKSLKEKYKLEDKFITLSSGCDQNVGILKLWPQENWGELIKRIKDSGYSIIQLGNIHDINLPGVKKVCCDNLIDLMYVLSESLMHISNEGGLVHLAHAVGTKSAVLFGPTTPTLYGYPDNINIYPFKCPSCWWTVPGWSRSCKLGNKSCINIDNISVDDVYTPVIIYLNTLKGYEL